MLGWLMASAWSKKRRKFTDFLPPWYDKPREGQGKTLRSFEDILRMADANH